MPDYPLLVLFVPILTQAFFAFVGRHFMPFSFFTAWHCFNVFELEKKY
jgi:hypothetical protein